MPLGLFLGSDFPIEKSNKLEDEQALQFQAMREDLEPKHFVDPVTGEQVSMFPDFALGVPCVSCHNDHEKSAKHDWKLGDLMGATTWSYPDDSVTTDEFMRMLLAYRSGVETVWASYAEELAQLPETDRPEAAGPRRPLHSRPHRPPRQHRQDRRAPHLRAHDPHRLAMKQVARWFGWAAALILILGWWMEADTWEISNGRLPQHERPHPVPMGTFPRAGRLPTHGKPVGTVGGLAHPHLAAASLGPRRPQHRPRLGSVGLAAASLIDSEPSSTARRPCAASSPTTLDSRPSRSPLALVHLYRRDVPPTPSLPCALMPIRFTLAALSVLLHHNKTPP